VAGGASGSVLVLLVAAAGSIVLARRSLRRRRLAEGGPDERIAGAWSEFTDALRLSGRPLPDHLAATEAAAYAAAPGPPPRGLVRRQTPVAPAESGAASLPVMSGSLAVMTAQAPADGDAETLPPLDELVAAVNTVGFAPGAAAEAQAQRAGAQVIAYAAALRARRSWWRRLWWSVNPGPLRWRRSR
jgi:hypothetical protein